MTESRRIVAIGESGHRIGEDHPNAKLSNREVDLVLELREAGWSYRRISLKMEISKTHVRYICLGRLRAQTPAKWRTVRE